MRQAIEEGFILDVLENYTPYKLAFKLANDGKEWDEKEVERSEAMKGLMRWVRLHPYNISIPGRPQAKKLGISRNGYLGFYWHADVTDYWKIEPLELTEDGLVCHLRDHRGHRVGIIKDTPHKSGDWVALLNVEEGEVFTFLLVPLG